jgi:hypothetical protein
MPSNAGKRGISIDTSMGGKRSLGDAVRLNKREIKSNCRAVS